MCKAGLSACWEHFHLSGACAAQQGERWEFGLAPGAPAQSAAGDKAEQDLEHCSWELQVKARKQGNSLLDFESHIATEARLNAYQMQKYQRNPITWAHGQKEIGKLPGQKGWMCWLLSPST